jgi:hypothetical protein
MRPRSLAGAVAVSISILLQPTIYAAPAHVIRFGAAGRTIVCDTYAWHDVLTFYNTTNATATIRVLGISNGSPYLTDPDTIDVPPGAVVSADNVLRGAWQPPLDRGGGLWMMHLDVPAGIIIESRDEMFLGNSCIPISLPIPPASLGKVSLPVFREAVPANERQVHLGTDLGSKGARINVGIYNESQMVANAHIEVRRSCDNSIVDSRDVQVPPDTLVQVAGLQPGLNTCAPFATTFTWLRYTVVTVDQPSMTFVSAVSERLNIIPGLAPEVGLGISGNVRY